ncbi:tetratricopeptide repeat protein [Streptomyces sp. NPDC005423]|uniref:tetratricopeptide repeat protein n=1 Tax=Streptomyces sp. NPDC005423 TaxID=3155343 RepID=UPI0033B30CC6
MSRLSREKKREQKRAGLPADVAVPSPFDVRVPVDGPGVGGASIGGVPVTVAPGEEIQHAVLNHLHRIAVAAGHPVLATIRDDRIGYVVPLRMAPDGSSHFTADPYPTLPPSPAPAPPAPPAPLEPRNSDDWATRVMRTLPEPSATGGVESAPTHRLRTVRGRTAGTPPTFPLHTVPEPPRATPPGSVAPPTGAFGPPPSMDGTSTSTPTPAPSPGPVPTLDPAPAPVRALIPDPALLPRELESDVKPTPVRGFDAVAEAVLGDGPLDGGGSALLAEPVGRINEAVRAGRIDTAAGLAEQAVEEASRTLGPEHTEVLRLRELSAYIAYLAGEPVRAFRLCLDVARIHRRTDDTEAAYGDIQSAASAWRAVRDPEEGLRLGGELIGLWAELAAEEGPAAEESDQLDAARARMTRLTERAARK